MENYTISNIVVQTILNINFTVILNVFFISGSVTGGILIAKQIVGMLLSYLHYKWAMSYEMRTAEIKELNSKMHDRLVELGEAIDTDTKPEKYDNIRTRLRYNSARLCKYDNTILTDAKELLNMLSTDPSVQTVISPDNTEKANQLIEQIRIKVDKLWF